MSGREEHDTEALSILGEMASRLRGATGEPSAEDLAETVWTGNGKEAAPLRAVVEQSDEEGNCRIRVLCGRPEDGGAVMLLPSGRTARLRLREKDDAERPTVAIEGEPPLAGDILCDPERPAQQSDMFSLDVIWLDDEPLYAGRSYGFLSPGGRSPGLVGKLKARFDPESGKALAARELKRGESGRIEVELDAPVSFDPLSMDTPLSRVALVDGETGRLLGLGIIRFALRRASNIRWQELELDKGMRAAALGQRPFVLWFTGLSGCGKSTVASLLEKRLHDLGKHAYVLDGDNVRHGLCKDLGFTEADRIENMRRVTEVARLMVDAGLIVLVSFISPFRDERERARRSFEEGEFLEVFVDTPLEVCEARDIKGLYAKARKGLIRNFTGIDSPYERPENPDIHLPGSEMPPESMVETIIGVLRERDLLD